MAENEPADGRRELAHRGCQVRVLPGAQADRDRQEVLVAFAEVEDDLIALDGQAQSTALGSKVTKIDAFTVKQATAPGKIEFPNVTITLAEVSSETWRQWHEDFVINGNNGEGQEKQGKLAFLAPTGQETLLTISFHGLGIFKLSRERSDVNAVRASRMIAELYCERMELALG